MKKYKILACGRTNHVNSNWWRDTGMQFLKLKIHTHYTTSLTKIEQQQQYLNRLHIYATSVELPGRQNFIIRGIGSP